MMLSLKVSEMYSKKQQSIEKKTVTKFKGKGFGLTKIFMKTSLAIHKVIIQTVFESVSEVK